MKKRKTVITTIGDITDDDDDDDIDIALFSKNKKVASAVKPLVPLAKHGDIKKLNYDEIENDKINHSTNTVQTKSISNPIEIEDLDSDDMPQSQPVTLIDLSSKNTTQNSFKSKTSKTSQESYPIEIIDDTIDTIDINNNDDKNTYESLKIVVPTIKSASERMKSKASSNLSQQSQYTQLNNIIHSNIIILQNDGDITHSKNATTSSSSSSSSSNTNVPISCTDNIKKITIKFRFHGKSYLKYLLPRTLAFDEIKQSFTQISNSKFSTSSSSSSSSSSSTTTTTATTNMTTNISFLFDGDTIALKDTPDNLDMDDDDIIDVKINKDLLVEVSERIYQNITTLKTMKISYNQYIYNTYQKMIPYSIIEYSNGKEIVTLIKL